MGRWTNTVTYISLLGMLLINIWGCSDDISDEAEKQDDTIMAFSVQTCETWECPTRSAADTIQSPHLLKMRSSEGKEVSMQVAAAYGIMSEPLLNNSNPVTRSAPVGSIYNNQFGLMAYAYDKTSTWASASVKTPIMFDYKALVSR